MLGWWLDREITRVGLFSSHQPIAMRFLWPGRSARWEGSSSMDSSAPAAHGAFEIDSDDKVGSGEDPDSEVDTATSMADTGPRIFFCFCFPPILGV